ncbi:DDE family transposase [Nocardia mexicana]|uniref:DDE family transposase n=1 Tax=Nocardia mexicana TaxID=279262 RepID=A0A370GNX0_9NOCA|nr:DDE family transposase [Nocardia mexicana]
MGQCSSRLAADGSGVMSQARRSCCCVPPKRWGCPAGCLRSWRRGANSWRCMIWAMLCWIRRSPVAPGGDCLADVDMLHTEPSVFGAVASDPTVSRIIAAPAADTPKALSAIRSARAAARAVAWDRTGHCSPNHGIDTEHPLIIDLDATLTIAHSDKELSDINIQDDHRASPTRFLGRPTALAALANPGHDAVSGERRLEYSRRSQAGPSRGVAAVAIAAGLSSRAEGAGAYRLRWQHPTNSSTISPPGTCSTRSGSR